MPKIIKNLIVILSIVLIAAGAVSCGDAWAEGKVRVAVSLFPYYDIAKTIGGERADVKLILGPGADQHHFEPTVGQIKNIKNCDIFVYTADNMETWAQKITGGSNASVIKAADYAEFCDGDQSGHSHDDPHVWLYVPNMINVAEVIRDALIESDPEGERVYSQNAANLIESLRDLHEDFTDELPQGGKKLIFAGHFAYGVMLKGYGIDNYLTLYEGVNEDEDIKLKNMDEIVNAISAEDIGVIYADYYDQNPVLANQIIAEVNSAKEIKVLRLHTLANLNKKDFESGVSYIQLMRHNLQMLKEGLI